jgi:hypothetical protein
MAESSYHITLTNDGDGNYTGAVRRGGTAASGGTTIAGTGADVVATATKLIGELVERAKHVVTNDRADGN